MKNIQKPGNIFLTILFLILLTQHVPAQKSFVHPGISHKRSDLDRMKYMVASGVDPWITSYNLLKANGYASYNYVVRGHKDSTVLYANLNSSYNKIKFDGLAAYYNALMWYITGDKRHADKAIEIFNAWSNIRSIKSGGTLCLDAGRVIWKLLEAAEIIKSTYDGWSKADMDRFKAMLVYPGYSTKSEPSTAISKQNATFYWYMYNGDPGRHGNQGLFGMRGIAAMGIFLDNDTIYDRAIRYIKGLPHRPDDLPYPSGPRIVSANRTAYNSYYDEYSPVSPYQKNDSTDFGYNELIRNYIYENGQGQESSRDQGHGLLGISIIHTICEMAWNQGEDIFSFLNYRPLLGLEFYYRYNLSYKYNFADQPAPWEPTVESGEYIKRRDRSSRWTAKKINPWNAGDTARLTRGTNNTAPIYELVLAHYKSRMNLPKSQMKWTLRGDSISRKEVGYEQGGFEVDHPGWGGLTFHRPDSCPGDPVNSFSGNKPVYGMTSFPGKLEAENFDHFTLPGDGKTWHDLSAGNSLGKYRTTDVDIDTCVTGFQVTDIEPGEWLSYTVYIPVSGKYDISAHYAAGNGNGKIKISFGGVFKIEEAAMPFGDSYSTGWSKWKDHALASNVDLSAGVQNLKIYFSGEKGFNLDYLTFKYHQTLTFNPLSSKKTGDADFIPSASATSMLPVTYSSSNENVATILNGKIHIVGAGTAEITASQEGDNNFAPAAPITRTLTVVPSTGISDQSASKISVLPNPSDGIFRIDLPGDQKFSIGIFSQTGKEVYSAILDKQTGYINISDFPDGIYLLNISTLTQKFTKKIVKQ